MEGTYRHFDGNWQRTTYCGMVSGRAGEEIPAAVNGWVRRRRDLGGLIFIELWDHTGVVQVVFNPELTPKFMNGLETSAANLFLPSGEKSARGRKERPTPP